VHVILHLLPVDKAALELVWWSDQVFSIETDDLAQFQALAEYFVELQAIFQSSQIFISKESGLEHDGNGEAWVEI
jgi:hypothetical protein